VARLIELEPAVEPVPANLAVRVGDVLRFEASGGRVAAGASVDLLGIYTAAIVGSSGDVVVPAGPPNVVMFQARGTGRAEVDVFVDDGYRPGETRRVRISVEEG
jgi:hypothetical protein